MQANIISVYDEGALEHTSYIGAKGLAVLVEADGERTLFGTGRNGRYLVHNLEYLDVDPDTIDRAVISHGHRDHSGGLDNLLKVRTRPMDIHYPASARGEKRLLGSTGVFVRPELSDKANLLTVEGWTDISEHLSVTRPIGFGNGDSECFLVLKTRKGPVVLSGCSHCGVKSVTDEVKSRMGVFPKAYIGGVHIGKKEDAKADGISAVFSDCGCDSLYLNHCTGLNGMTRLRVNLGLSGVNNFYVGSKVQFEI